MLILYPLKKSCETGEWFTVNLNLLYLLLMQHFAKIGTYGIPHLGACESVAGFYLNIMGYRKVTRDYCLAQNMQISTRIHPRTCNILRKGQHISESRLRCYLPSFEVEKKYKSYPPRNLQNTLSTPIHKAARVQGVK